MTTVVPFPPEKIVTHWYDAADGRFAYVYAMQDGTYRLRFGFGENAGEMYEGLKREVADELSNNWMAGCTPDEVHMTAYQMGVRG